MKLVRFLTVPTQNVSGVEYHDSYSDERNPARQLVVNPEHVCSVMADELRPYRSHCEPKRAPVAVVAVRLVDGTRFLVGEPFESVVAKLYGGG